MATATDDLTEARQLLAAARIAVANPDAGLDDAWPRATALLTRQALELVIAARLVARIPEVGGLSMRVKLACLGELGEPADVGWAAVYLASPAAKFVTGAVVPIDGGVSMGF